MVIQGNLALFCCFTQQEICLNIKYYQTKDVTFLFEKPTLGKPMKPFIFTGSVSS